MILVIVIIFSISINNLTFLTYSRLGSAYSSAGNVAQSAECFQQAEQIYRLVPGEGSYFYNNHFMPLYHKYL